jgi:NADH dehydrogenase
VEAGPRLLPGFPESFAKHVQKRLEKLGVAVFVNKPVVKEDANTLFFKDSDTIQAKTVIWTAGVKPNHLYSTIDGLVLDKHGRAAVDDFLQAEGWENVFVIGDAAATIYTGMAQTAIHDGAYAADVISKKIYGKPLTPYVPKKPFYIIPVGRGWAAFMYGRFCFYGRLCWWLRRMADARFFLSILPPRKAYAALKMSTV